MRANRLSSLIDLERSLLVMARKFDEIYQGIVTAAGPPLRWNSNVEKKFRTELRRTRENKNLAGQMSKGSQGRQRRGRCVTLAGRMISPDLGGAMVTNHLGKSSRRTIRCSRHFISSLLRRTPLL